MYNQRPYRRKRWFGFYSQDAVDKGCPIFVFQDRNGNLYSITGSTQRRDGYGYYWPDKVLVCETTHLRHIETIGFDLKERPVPYNTFLNGNRYA